jgi:hypothetical protein
LSRIDFANEVSRLKPELLPVSCPSQIHCSAESTSEEIHFANDMLTGFGDFLNWPGAV